MEFSDYSDREDHREDDTLEGKDPREFPNSKRNECSKVDESFDGLVVPKSRVWSCLGDFEIRDTEDTKEFDFFKEPPGQSKDDTLSTARSTLPDEPTYLSDFSRIVFSEVEEIVRQVDGKEWVSEASGRTLDITDKLSDSLREKLKCGDRVVLESNSKGLFCKLNPTRLIDMKEVFYDDGPLWKTVEASIRSFLDGQLMAIAENPRQWVDQLSIEAITNKGDSSRLDVLCRQGEISFYLTGRIAGGVSTYLSAFLVVEKDTAVSNYDTKGEVSAFLECLDEESEALLNALLDKGWISLHPPSVAEPSPELEPKQSELSEKVPVKEEIIPKQVNQPQPVVDPKEVWRDRICTEALAIVKNTNARAWSKSEYGITLDVTDFVSEGVTEKLSAGERLIVKREKGEVVFSVQAHESEREIRVFALSGRAAEPFLTAVQEKMEKLTDELDKECNAFAETIGTWITNLPDEAIEGYQRGDLWQYIGCKQGNVRLVLNREPYVSTKGEFCYLDSAKIVISAGPIVFEKNPEYSDTVHAAISAVLARSPSVLAGFRLSDRENEAKILEVNRSKSVSRWESLKGKISGWFDIVTG